MSISPKTQRQWRISGDAYRNRDVNVLWLIFVTGWCIHAWKTSCTSNGKRHMLPWLHFYALINGGSLFLVSLWKGNNAIFHVVCLICFYLYDVKCKQYQFLMWAMWAVAQGGITKGRRCLPDGIGYFSYALNKCSIFMHATCNQCLLLRLLWVSTAYYSTSDELLHFDWLGEGLTLDGIHARINKKD